MLVFRLQEALEALRQRMAGAAESAAHLLGHILPSPLIEPALTGSEALSPSPDCEPEPEEAQLLADAQLLQVSVVPAPLLLALKRLTSGSTTAGGDCAASRPPKATALPPSPHRHPWQQRDCLYGG